MHQGVTIRDSDIEMEYLATQTGVAVLDFSRSGKLEVSGQNAVQFLNGLVTNDLKSLTPGSGLLAAFLNVHGKVLALTRIYRRENSFLLELDESKREAIFRNLSRFVPAGEFFVTDVSETLALISLQGPRVDALVASLTNEPIGNDSFSISECEIALTTVLVARNSRCGNGGLDIFVPVESAPIVRQAILTSGETFGALAVGHEAFEIARIDAGIPREPDDISENNILLEAGLEEAVSYTKGCYLGQEIIARIHWRGQPAKRLKRLRVDAEDVPPRGAELFAADGKKVGEITSSVAIPGRDIRRVAALAYVHRYYLTEGTRFNVRVGGSVVGEAELLA